MRPENPTYTMSVATRRPLSVIRKVVLAVALAPVLWLATSTSIDGVLATRAPALVLKWAPWSSIARITLSNAELNTGQAVSRSVLIHARTLAQQALDRSPIQSAAAGAIGLSDLVAGNEANARSAFAYAERLSRRDLPTQIYWIETSVAHGDVHGALRHYDVAMRVSVASRAMLGNIVIAASAQPQVATELAKVLRMRPLWLPEFYQRLMGQGDNPTSLLHIASTMGFDARNPAQAPFVSMTLNRLVALGAYRDAQILYERSIGEPDEAIRNGGFERPNRLQPFDWTVAGEPTYSGIIETRAGWPGDNVLTVTGTEANDVARQLLLLAPGRYRLDAKTANVRQEPETRPRLNITCVSGQKIVASIPFAPAGTSPASMTGQFVVPANCPAQWLTLRNTPAFDPVESEPWIDDITVRRTAGT